MSLFQAGDVSLNDFQYIFYSYSANNPNVLQATHYDRTQNLVSSTDISFSTKTVGDMMLFLENSQSNPYVLGKDNVTPYFRNIDIAFSGLYNTVLTSSQHQTLMTYINTSYKDIYGEFVKIYTVKANGSSNYIIDNVSQPYLLESLEGTYLFDQSDSTNSGHILRFRNKSTQLDYNENVTYAGTPGSPNSFAIIKMTYSTPLLEYYCENHSNMYGSFQVLQEYSVKVVTNLVGDSVYSIQYPNTSVYYNQPYLLFNAGDNYMFDISDPTMANYNLVFGTSVDDANTINYAVFSEINGKIVLDIPSGYSGDTLVLFDSSNANMGYIVLNVDTLNTTDLVFHIDASQYNYSHNSQINMSDVSINDISPLKHTLSNVSYTTGITFNVNTTSARKSLYWENPNGSDGGGNDHLRYDVPSGTFSDNGYVTFMVCNLQNTVPVVWNRGDSLSRSNLPYSSNRGSQFPTDSKKISVLHVAENNNKSWSKLNAEPNISDDDPNISEPINIQIVKFNPYHLSYAMLGISGDTYSQSISAQNVYEYNDSDSTYSHFSLGSTRYYNSSDAYSPCKGYIYEFLVYKNAYMNNSTISSIQDYLSKKWFTQDVDEIPSYNITVSNEVFYIDNSEKSQIIFTASSTYMFDQSDSTNANQQIVFGYTFDSSNILVSTDGVQTVGSPGQPGAYTLFTVPSNPTGTVYYYSDGSANMGYY